MGRRATRDLSTKTSRLKLEPKTNPHYAEVETGVHLGYTVPTAGRTADGKLKRAIGKAGRWSVRRLMVDGTYKSQALRAQADDVRTANGRTVMTFDQAVTAARKLSGLVGTADVTVEQAMTEWAEGKNAEAIEKRARLNNLSAARRISEAFKGQTLKTITARKIEAWRDRFLDGAEDPETRRKRRATANRELANLKAGLTSAARRHRFNGDPVWTGVKKFAKADSHNRREVILTVAQRSRWVSEAEEWESTEFANLLRALFHTAARYGEIRNARVADFNMEAGTLFVTGKTGPRSIALGPDATDFFGSIVAGVNDPDRFILINPNRGCRWQDDDQRDPVTRSVKRAKLPQGTTLYTCRHCTISDWISAGVPIRAVAEQAGTSVEMIERTYAKFLPSQRAEWFATPGL